MTTEILAAANLLQTEVERVALSALLAANVNPADISPLSNDPSPSPERLLFLVQGLSNQINELRLTMKELITITRVKSYHDLQRFFFINYNEEGELWPIYIPTTQQAKL